MGRAAQAISGSDAIITYDIISSQQFLMSADLVRRNPSCLAALHLLFREFIDALHPVAVITPSVQTYAAMP